MKRAVFCTLLLVVLFLVACSPGPSSEDIDATVAIRVVLALTEAAEVEPVEADTPETPTPEPTDTPQPTETPAPMPTAISETCTEQAANFIIELDNLVAVWDDANALASSTPRINLAEQISPLQEIKQQTANQDVPECAGSILDLMVNYMQSTIDGYLAFLEERNPDPYFHAADVQLELWRVSLEDLDLRQQDDLYHVHYYLGDIGSDNIGSSVGTDIFYYDENEEEVKLENQRLPWMYDFYAQPPAFLSVSASLWADECVIMVNGQIVTFYDGPGVSTCRYHLEPGWQSK